MTQETSKKLGPIKVKIGKRFHIDAVVFEEDDIIVLKVTSIKWWCLAFSATTVSLVSIILQVIDMLG